MFTRRFLRWPLKFWCATCTAAVFPLMVSAQSFTKIVTGEIVNTSGLFQNCVWGDYDDNGYEDLFVSNAYGDSFLYRNNHDGTFTATRFGSYNLGIATGCAWGDFNNDGHLDLLRVFQTFQRSGVGIYLFRNAGDGGFTAQPVSSKASVAFLPALCDFDNDGLLDFISNDDFYLDLHVHQNLGSGQFASILLTNSQANITPATVWGDFDNDGAPDLFVAGGPNQRNILYRNNGDGTLTPVASSTVSELSNSSTGAWGDYDNDGFLDLFVPNRGGTNNFLYRNNSDGTFTKVTNGIVVNDGGNSYDCAWADFDNDGWLDLFVANYAENNSLYRNNGDGTFSKIKQGSIVTDGGTSTACAWADYNNDGFPDLFVGNSGPAFSTGSTNFLYRNDGNSNHWIKVKCVGNASSRSGIGAKISVHATIRGASLRQIREISGGNGVSQNSLIAGFGLGNATNVERIRVDWPSGVFQEMDNVAPDQIVIVTELSSPRITMHPVNQTVIPGTNVIFTAVAVGGSPLAYQWHHGRADITGATNASFALTNVGWADLGGYSVTVTEGTSPFTAKSRTAYLSFFPPPLILSQPLSQSVSIGATVGFSASVRSSIPFSLQWSHNGQSLLGETNLSLVLINAQIADAGEYVLEAASVTGSGTSAIARLVVDSTFTKITTGNIVTDGGGSYGCAWGDFNGDGLLDLMVASGGERNLLYQNDGSGSFSRVLSNSIVEPRNLYGRSEACAWADFDNDGRLDLFRGLAGCCLIWPGTGGDLFRNAGNGVFAMTNLLTAFFTGCAWGDYDNDGNVDLFLSALDFNFLLRNKGDGGFAAVSSGSGAPIETARSRACAWGDYDNDGDLDLFVANVNLPVGPQNSLFRNDGQGRFQKVEGPIVTDPGCSYGCAWADYDNDGDLDLFVANHCGPNFLYRNNGDGTFTRITDVAPVTEPGETAGCTWADYDNDGFLDLFLTHSGKNRLYHNNGDSSFTSVTEGSLVNEGAGSWGCAWGDYDNDGYQDLFVANTGNGNLLYHNNGGSNNWITIKCIGTLSNRSAIGAKVRVSAVLDGTPQWQLREISGGSGLSSQNDLRAAFGVRQARRVDLIRIEWPSGIVQELSDIAVNQLLTVTEPPSQLRGEHLADGAFRVKLIGQKARGYELIASTDLVQWVSLTNLWNSTGTIFYTDPASTNFAQRFYQVVTR